MFIFDITRKGSKRKVIQRLPSWFRPHQYLIAGDGRTAAAIDERRKLLCLVNERNQYSFFKGRQVLDYGLTISSDKRVKQSFWSSAFGYLAGRIIDKRGGLQIVGGLFPRLRMSDEIQTIHLVLRLNDWQHPYFPILIYEKGVFSSVQSAQNIANHWEALIRVMKHRH